MSDNFMLNAFKTSKFKSKPFPKNIPQILPSYDDLPEAKLEKVEAPKVDKAKKVKKNADSSKE